MLSLTNCCFVFGSWQHKQNRTAAVFNDVLTGNRGLTPNLAFPWVAREWPCKLQLTHVIQCVTELYPTSVLDKWHENRLHGLSTGHECDRRHCRQTTLYMEKCVQAESLALQERFCLIMWASSEITALCRNAATCCSDDQGAGPAKLSGGRRTYCRPTAGWLCCHGDLLRPSQALHVHWWRKELTHSLMQPAWYSQFTPC